MLPLFRAKNEVFKTSRRLDPRLTPRDVSNTNSYRCLAYDVSTSRLLYSIVYYYYIYVVLICITTICIIGVYRVFLETSSRFRSFVNNIKGLIAARVALGKSGRETRRPRFIRLGEKFKFFGEIGFLISAPPNFGQVHLFGDVSTLFSGQKLDHFFGQILGAKNG